MSFNTLVYKIHGLLISYSVNFEVAFYSAILISSFTVTIIASTIIGFISKILFFSTISTAIFYWLMFFTALCVSLTIILLTYSLFQPHNDTQLSDTF